MIVLALRRVNEETKREDSVNDLKCLQFINIPMAR